MSDLAERAASPDQDLDAAIEQARAALSAVVRVPEPGGGPGQVAQARALLASLLYQRLTRAAARLDHDDPAAVSAVRADRNEAIAVSSALLYDLPSGGPAWRDVALMVGRLSYDRFHDAWPGAARPDPDDLDAAKVERGKMLEAERAQKLGLVTFAPDDIDWDDEIRVFLEERASFSPDALTGLEANLRFAGPETMESKIFARLTAWQNWIFQRPNAIGEDGALKRYGTGQKPVFDTRRV